jgi:hypothetical protein
MNRRDDSMIASLAKTCDDSGKEEKRPQPRPYNERSQGDWYPNTPLEKGARRNALTFSSTRFDNISGNAIRCPC